MPRTPVLGLPYPAAIESPDGPAQIKALADALDGQDPQASGAFIIGEIRQIAITNPPPGWLECNGAARSRSTYSLLFDAIGTTFGAGDGSTTFNVPDCRGRALIGAGQGPGLTNRATGVRGGAETHTLSVAEMPSHNHGGATGGGTSGGMSGNNPHTHNANMGASAVATGIAMGNIATAGNTQIQAANIAHTHSIPALAISAQGGNGAHDNMPPFIAIPVFIFAGV